MSLDARTYFGHLRAYQAVSKQPFFASLRTSSCDGIEQGAVGRIS